MFPFFLPIKMNLNIVTQVSKVRIPSIRNYGPIYSCTKRENEIRIYMYVYTYTYGFTNTHIHFYQKGEEKFVVVFLRFKKF